MANLNAQQKSTKEEEGKDDHSASICTQPQPSSSEMFNLLSLQEIIALPRKFRKSKRIYIDVSGTKYDVVKEVAQDVFTWNLLTGNDKINQEDWNICWYDTYISEDDLRKMLPYQKINHFPGSFNLGKKNYLGKNLCKMRKLFPEEYDFYPRTWLLPYQYEELRQYYERNSKQKPVFIIKPEASCQGRGIFLSKKIDTVLDPNDHYVVQEYVKNPFLIDGLKFDFRIYVMLKSVCPLKIFMFREGLARFATVKYSKPSKQNIHNMCMHLTNYAVNKKNPDFIFNTKEGEDNLGHKRSFTAVLKDSGKDINKLMMEIRKIIVKTLCSVQPYLSHLYKSCQPKEENNEMCFELFGFDVMLDDKLKPLLLEVNHTPSFTCDTPLDYQIKKNLIFDSLILSDIKHKEKLNYLEQKKAIIYLKGQGNRMTQQEQEEKRIKIDKYERKHLGGFIRIIPSDDDLTDYNSYMESAQSIHDEFTGTKKPPLKSNFIENCNQATITIGQLQSNNNNNNQQPLLNRPLSAKIKQIKPRPVSGIPKPSLLIVQKENNNLNNSYTGPHTTTGFISNQQQNNSASKSSHQRKLSSRPNNQLSTLQTLQEDNKDNNPLLQYPNSSGSPTALSQQQQQQQYQIIELPIQTLQEQLQQQNDDCKAEINQKLDQLKREIQTAQEEARRQLFSPSLEITSVGTTTTSSQQQPNSQFPTNDSQRNYQQTLNFYQNNRKNLSQTAQVGGNSNGNTLQTSGGGQNNNGGGGGGGYNSHSFNNQYVVGHGATNNKFNVMKHEQFFGQTLGSIGGNSNTRTTNQQIQKLIIRNSGQGGLQSSGKNINSSFNNDDSSQLPLNIQKMRIIPSSNKTVIESTNTYKERMQQQGQPPNSSSDLANNEGQMAPMNRNPKGFTIKSKIDMYSNHQKTRQAGQKQLTSTGNNDHAQKHLNSYTTLRSNSYNNLLKNEELSQQQQVQAQQQLQYQNYQQHHPLYSQMHQHQQFSMEYGNNPSSNGAIYQYPMNVNVNNLQIKHSNHPIKYSKINDKLSNLLNLRKGNEQFNLLLHVYQQLFVYM